MLRLEASVDAMGSTYSVALYDEDRTRMETAAEAAFEEVRRLDQLLSNYKPDSEWSQVNRYAAERPVPVSQELFDLLAACIEYSKEGDGAFDITVGPLMKVWGFYKGTGHLLRKRLRYRILSSPVAANNPAVTRSESPGRKNPNSSPVSANTIIVSPV